MLYRLALSPWDAALGVEREVPTLGGNVSLRIPAGSDSGRRLRLRGRGMPGEPTGDQFVIIEVRAPEPRNEVQREAWQRLAESYAED